MLPLIGWYYVNTVVMLQNHVFLRSVKSKVWARIMLVAVQ